MAGSLAIRDSSIAGRCSARIGVVGAFVALLDRLAELGVGRCARLRRDAGAARIDVTAAIHRNRRRLRLFSASAGIGFRGRRSKLSVQVQLANQLALADNRTLAIKAVLVGLRGLLLDLTARNRGRCGIDAIAKPVAVAVGKGVAVARDRDVTRTWRRCRPRQTARSHSAGQRSGLAG